VRQRHDNRLEKAHYPEEDTTAAFVTEARRRVAELDELLRGSEPAEFQRQVKS
jgi:hypothetical protein